MFVGSSPHILCKQLCAGLWIVGFPSVFHQVQLPTGLFSCGSSFFGFAVGLDAKRTHWRRETDQAVVPHSLSTKSQFSFEGRWPL